MNIIEELKKNTNKNPRKIAVYGERYVLTYEQFDKITDFFAKEIEDKLNKSEEAIMLNLEQNETVLIAIYAILKSGNTYVPIGKTMPKDRMRYIQHDSNCNFIISNKEEHGFKHVMKFTIDDIGRVLQRESLIKENVLYNEEVTKYPYILYTSGSTGTPKGVKVTRKNLDYILDNMQIICPVDNDSVYCFSTPYTFDVSITEIFGWIKGNGAVAVIGADLLKNHKCFLEKVKKFKISHFATSPSALIMLLNLCTTEELDILSNYIKYIMVAGEKFNPSIAQIWEKHKFKSRMFNLYGPTEATVYSTFYEIKHPYKGGDIPIGKPLKGTRVIIETNETDELGELILFGDGIAEGYLNNIELTNTVFGQNQKGIKYYKTGDICSYNEKGEIVYIGRKDQQVQIHGIRVELGDIEYYFAKQQNIESVAVIYYDNKLFAFIKPLNDSFDLKIAKDMFISETPRYMQPNKYIVVDNMPLNDNRKIDKKKLMLLASKNAGENMSSSQKK